MQVYREGFTSRTPNACNNPTIGCGRPIRSSPLCPMLEWLNEHAMPEVIVYVADDSLISHQVVLTLPDPRHMNPIGKGQVGRKNNMWLDYYHLEIV
ncbi:hypothetical protein JHK86_004564 [Glycine max]|nr:hypothetical protein JHK86_004564 [Glycine max]